VRQPAWALVTGESWPWRVDCAYPALAIFRRFTPRLCLREGYWRAEDYFNACGGTDGRNLMPAVVFDTSEPPSRWSCHSTCMEIIPGVPASMKPAFSNMQASFYVHDCRLRQYFHGNIGQ